MPVVWPIALLTILLIAGLVLLIRGVRGRLIDDHPLCRACGFDLFGLPAGSIVCSECGAEICGAKATRIGHRKRRPGMALFGSLLILPMILGVSIWGWGTLQHINWIEHAPYWYVVRQSRSAVPADRDAALNELLRRLNAGELSHAHVAALVDAYLAVQADLKQPWQPKYGDFIDSVESVGKLPGPKWAQYLRNAPQYRIRLRPEVRRGDSLPIQVEETGARCGGRSPIYTSTVLTPEDGGPISPNQQLYEGGGVTAQGHLLYLHRLRIDPTHLVTAADGPQILRVNLTVEVADRPPTVGTSPLATKVLHFQLPWRLVPADASTVKPIEDPGARLIVKKAISIRRLSANTMNDYLNINVHLDRPPVPLSYRIFLRANGRESPIGSLAVPAGVTMSWGTGGQAWDFRADIVDVIFRPDAQPALDTIDMTKYWNGKIVIKNVKVAWPTTKPAGK